VWETWALIEMDMKSWEYMGEENVEKVKWTGGRVRNVENNN
jgi:hypothetical protein